MMRRLVGTLVISYAQQLETIISNSNKNNDDDGKFNGKCVVMFVMLVACSSPGEKNQNNKNVGQ